MKSVDFLVKGEFEEKLLLKTITYCIERKKNQLKVEEAMVQYLADTFKVGMVAIFVR